jgi:Zn-dependent protease
MTEPPHPHETPPPDDQSDHRHEQARPVQATPVWKALLGPVVFLGLLALKFGKVAFIAIKGVKFFGTAMSMVVSIAAYTLFYGLPFAAGFVLLIFVHELGHAYQLRREGIPAGAPVFIPFLGAAIAMRGMPHDAAMEARVGIAGPILGSLGAALVHLAAVVSGSDFLLALAFTGYFLNLFNLVPISPLDGGRIAAALSPKLWFGGLALMVGLFLVSPNPVLLIILVLGALDSWSRWRSRDTDGGSYYREVSPQFRTGLAVAWLGLIVLLVLGMGAAHVPREL